ncbi:hypothetical protein ACFL1M_04340 [Patescibacteria group bacterium]
MTKLKTIVNELKEKHSNQLKNFKKIHDEYAKDRKNNQEKFNSEGKKIMEMLRTYENILCGKQERSDMARYSSSLSEKYWAEIKKDFPYIDFIGVKIT